MNELLVGVMTNAVWDGIKRTWTFFYCRVSGPPAVLADGQPAPRETGAETVWRWCENMIVSAFLFLLLCVAFSVSFGIVVGGIIIVTYALYWGYTKIRGAWRDLGSAATS